MLVIILVLMFITSFIYINLILSRAYRNKITVFDRLNRLKNSNKDDGFDELSLPFYQRVIKPLGDNLSETISRVTPSGIKGRINEKLAMAGNPSNLGVNQWLLIKSFFGIILPIGLGSVVISSYTSNSKSIAIIIGVTLIFFYFPDLALKQMTKNRQKEIVNSLPDVLDLLTVSVEAGLSFDGALSRLVNKVDGKLSKEFGRVLNEIRMGRSRKEALKEMSIRCGVSDLTTFIGSIIQADELGVGISNVLRIQSKQMRQKRRQRAQEKAMKAPIKMLFPLVIFIFPTIFSVLLGPAMIKIITEFAR